MSFGSLKRYQQSNHDDFASRAGRRFYLESRTEGRGGHVDFRRCAGYEMFPREYIEQEEKRTKDKAEGTPTF